MKKTIKTLLTTGFLLLFAGNVWALPIISGDQITMSTAANNATPYTMANNDETGAWSTYTTFCLESEIYFTPNVPYAVQSVEDYATSGSAPGTVSYVTLPNGDSRQIIGDSIDQRSKWLYASYVSGEIAANDSNKVQNAIWYLEDEEDGVADDWTYLSNQYSHLNKNNYETLGWDIKAVNLVTINGSVDVQSQLVGEYAPVPEPATMVLFGIGLLGLAGIGRKKFRSKKQLV